MDNMLDIYGDALKVRSQRMSVLASNIANAATPNFKAKDLDFRKAISLVSGGETEDGVLQKAMSYRVPLQPALDGNTVELSTEQTQFAENAVQYRTTLSFLEGRVGTLKRALKGE